MKKVILLKCLMASPSIHYSLQEHLARPVAILVLGIVLVSPAASDTTVLTLPLVKNVPPGGLPCLLAPLTRGTAQSLKI